MVSVISQGKRTYQNKLCSKCYNKYEQWSYCLSLIVFIMQLSSPQLKYTLQTFIIVSCFLQFCDFHFHNKFKKRSYSFFFGGDFLWNKFKKQYFVLLKNSCVLSKSVRNHNRPENMKHADNIRSFQSCILGLPLIIPNRNHIKV